MNCVVCAAEIPAGAAACPGCGRPAVAKKGSSVGIVLALIAVLAIPALGIMAVLGIYGVRKYIANAKTAEAKNVLGQIGRLAVARYDETHRLCPSASRSIPQEMDAVRARKYMSMGSEWRADAKADAGFACLGFSLATPQYYQYSYEATATSFVARAHGDLDGDGIVSTFELRGEVKAGRLILAPSLLEMDSDE